MPTAAVASTPPLPSSNRLPARSTPAQEVLREQARVLDSCPAPIAASAGEGPARFILRDRSVNALFTPVGLGIALVIPSAKSDQAPVPGWGLHWGLVGAQAVEPRPEGELAGRLNSFVGEPSRWKTDQATYSRVVYESVLPGVDLDVESRRHGLKYTIRAAAGADLASLRFRYEGAQEVRVLEDGTALEIRTGLGSIREDALLCWQERPGGRRPVEARYTAAGPDEVAIEFGDLDPALPLVIDPVISWFAFIGGATSTPNPANFATDEGQAIAVDGLGNVYVAGYTTTSDFPSTGGFDATFGGGQSDAFVTKINGSVPSVIWSTYLGGSGVDQASGIVLDASRNVYLAGTTTSTNFPTPNGFKSSLGGGRDAFVVRIDASGSSLAWGTLLGGTGSDNAASLAIDAAGNLIVAGTSNSTDFPVMNGLTPGSNGGYEAFVAKIAGTGPSILWSTYLGGSGSDMAGAVAVDGTGNVYVTGTTTSLNFPTTGGFDTTLGAALGKAFITKISGSGVTPSILWSTYLGGTNGGNPEYGYAIAVDGSGNVYVAGQTNSTTFPAVNGFDATFGGSFSDVFVAKISGATLSPSVVWASYLGGSGVERPYGIAVDSSGNVYVAGLTSSTDFPSTNGFHTTVNGQDAFLTKIDGTASPAAILWSTYFGGTNTEACQGMAVDASQNVYLTGYTESTDFDLTGAFDGTRGGRYDAFVTKIDGSGAAPSVVWSSYLGGSLEAGNDYGYGLAMDSSGNLYVCGSTYCTDFPTAGAYDASLGGSRDVFVSKLSAGTGSMVWSTYLGGASDDYGGLVAVDDSRNVIVTGSTVSADFPVPGGFDTTLGGSDVFVTKIAAAGNSLVWSTFLGGSGSESQGAVALDGAQNVYVAGTTYSADFPTPGAFDATFGGGGVGDGFVTKIGAAGALVWSSYFGGSGFDQAKALEVTTGAMVYLTGDTASADLPTTGGFDATLGGTQDAFVAKIDGSSVPAVLIWSSYLGGSGTDAGSGIALDGGGGVFVAGDTNSTNFPVPGGFSATNTGGQDAFVAKVNDLGATATLAWGTYLGGTSLEVCGAIATGSGGEVYVTGTTYSSVGFPTTGGFDSTMGGPNDAYVARIDSAAASATLAWSTYLGGTGEDYGYAIRVDATGIIAVAGYSDSGDFPGSGGFDTTAAGRYDAFVARILPYPPLAGGGGGGGGCGSTGLDLLLPLGLAWLLRRLWADSRRAKDPPAVATGNRGEDL